MEELLVGPAPKIIVPVSAAPMTPEEAAKGTQTVTMEFPNSVHLTIDTNQTVFYPQGVNEVPEHLADHWYLKAHQARRYYKPSAGQTSLVVTGLESLTKDELMIMAKGYGLSLHPSTGAAKIVAKINEAKAAKAEEPAE